MSEMVAAEVPFEGELGNWEDFRLFLAVAREGGLSPAGRVVGRSPATLGRRMLDLERRLSRVLFQRTDRGYLLTAEGQALMERLSVIEGQIARAARPEGHAGLPLVKVSAGSWTTLALLRSEGGGLTGRPADLRLRFTSEERVLDMAHREAVVGIRNSAPTETGLAGRRLGGVRFAPYARPDAPEQWIRVLADTPSARWVAQVAGKDTAWEVSAPRNALDLALAGAGRALLPSFIGEVEPALQRVGPVVEELSHDQWLVTHDDDRHLPEVRRVITRICHLLQAA